MPHHGPLTTTRRATEQDDAFLFDLFKSTRTPDLAQLPPLLLKIQYTGQKQTYAAQYPNSNHDLILINDIPIGRIWICRNRLVDISLLPQYQNQGIGKALVTKAIADAHRARLPLCCSIAVTNAGSLRFHQRLGFQIVSQDEVYYELRSAFSDS